MKFILLFSLVTSIAALNCSNGMNQSSNLAMATLPTTLRQFLSIVGSFFNDSWYTGSPSPGTVGIDNQIGSIRTFLDLTGTNVYNETLLLYDLNATFFEQSWQGPSDNGASINFTIFILGSYVEYLIGESTCDGSAVIMKFGSEACVTNVNTATSILLSNHVYGIQQVQTLLQIGNFTKCATNTSTSFIRSISLLTGLLSTIFGLSQMFL
jgi:hypothetical protein